MKNNDRYLKIKKITILGAIANFILGFLKIIIGSIGNSFALMIDGVHSLSDLLSDGLVLVAARYGSEDPDKEHPYGHGRIETAATLFLALFLIVVSFGIIYDAISKLITPDIPGKISLLVPLVAGISILVKETLYRYTAYYAKQVDSALLLANAWHHRSDAISSIVVLIAVLGSLLGIPYVDVIAGIIVALMITKIGWDLVWTSLKELIDTSIEQAELNEIAALIKKTSGVISIHQLRTRMMRGHIFVDVHVLVSSELSVSEGHQIAQRVHFSLIEKFSEVKDVTVHIDPEDDELYPPSLKLPSREQLLPLLAQYYKDFPVTKKLTLHYLAGKIDIDIYVSTDLLDKASKEDLFKQYSQKTADFIYIRQIRLYFL